MLCIRILHTFTFIVGGKVDVIHVVSRALCRGDEPSGELPAVAKGLAWILSRTEHTTAVLHDVCGNILVRSMNT